ncbi:MAG TPA: iron-sulfur cluster insertion protein ErpA, partial [Ktedonobacterales bacterium]|nr:iron-sulfur cluster insertion protein ErpA [Ktedonobacterales bacterium]
MSTKKKATDAGAAASSATAVPAAEVESEEDYFASLLQAGAPSEVPSETSSEAPPLVTLSAAAAEKVGALLTQEGDMGLGLRVFVAGGGCSGLQYGMTLDEEQDGDTVIAHAGLRVLVDEMSAQYLAGSEIDYVDSLMGAGFTVNNPNAVSTCG